MFVVVVVCCCLLLFVVVVYFEKIGLVLPKCGIKCDNALEARAVFADGEATLFAHRPFTVLRFPAKPRTFDDSETMKRDVSESSVLSRGNLTLSATLAVRERSFQVNTFVPVQVDVINEKRKTLTGVCFIVLSLSGASGKPVQFRLPDEVSFSVNAGASLSTVLEVPIRNDSISSKCRIPSPEIALASISLLDVLQNELGKVGYELVVQIGPCSVRLPVTCAPDYTKQFLAYLEHMPQVSDPFDSTLTVTEQSVTVKTAMVESSFAPEFHFAFDSSLLYTTSTSG